MFALLPPKISRACLVCDPSGKEVSLTAGSVNLAHFKSLRVQFVFASHSQELKVDFAQILGTFVNIPEEPVSGLVNILPERNMKNLWAVKSQTTKQRSWRVVVQFSQGILIQRAVFSVFKDCCLSECIDPIKSLKNNADNAAMTLGECHCLHKNN